MPLETRNTIYGILPQCPKQTTFGKLGLARQRSNDNYLVHCPALSFLYNAIQNLKSECSIQRGFKYVFNASKESAMPIFDSGFLSFFLFCNFFLLVFSFIIFFVCLFNFISLKTI